MSTYLCMFSKIIIPIFRLKLIVYLLDKNLQGKTKYENTFQTFSRNTVYCCLVGGFFIWLVVFVLVWVFFTLFFFLSKLQGERFQSHSSSVLQENFGLGLYSFRRQKDYLSYQFFQYINTGRLLRLLTMVLHLS